MDSVAIISSVLTLIAGIGVFLIACSMMSKNLESVSGEKLKVLFGKASKSKLLGVGIGALGTAAIQSSGATTVMVIGFVNAGIMSLEQSATFIYGANIGTTITGQIVALGMFGGNTVSTTVIFSAFAGIGAFLISFSKRDILKKIGGILAGFGMLFVGLSMMSSSMESFAQLDVVKLFLASINNTVLLVLIGALLTAVIQSSSVMTSIAIAMVFTGLITLDQGIFLTMGSNIGSCVVPIIAGLTSGRNAKRTALIHLLFNISGVAIFVIINTLLSFFTGGSITFGTIFERLLPNTPSTQLAMFHTVFNVITVILVLPLTKWLVALVSKIIPNKGIDGNGEKQLRLMFVDEHMLTTPPIAVRQLKKEISNMAKLAHDNFNLSLDMICTQDFSQLKSFEDTEKELNFLNQEIVQYIVKLLGLSLIRRDRIYLSRSFHTVADLERVGDYAENIVEYAQLLKNQNEKFSDGAITEISQMRTLIDSLFEDVMAAYKRIDISALERAEKTEDKIDEVTNIMAENHIRRLNKHTCTANVGAQYLSLSSNAERVADHFMNVAKTIKFFA